MRGVFPHFVQVLDATADEKEMSLQEGVIYELGSPEFALVLFIHARFHSVPFFCVLRMSAFRLL